MYGKLYFVSLLVLGKLALIRAQSSSFAAGVGDFKQFLLNFPS